MGDGTPTGRVGLTALNGLEDVQMIQHVLHAAVVGQSIEKRSDRVLCLHQLLPSTAVYRKRTSHAVPSPEPILFIRVLGHDVAESQRCWLDKARTVPEH